MAATTRSILIEMTLAAGGFQIKLIKIVLSFGPVSDRFKKADCVVKKPDFSKDQ